jgi:hypothetical protein
MALVEPSLCVNVERFKHDDRRLPSQSRRDLVRLQQMTALLNHCDDALALATKAQPPKCGRCVLIVRLEILVRLGSQAVLYVPKMCLSE